MRKLLNNEIIGLLSPVSPVRRRLEECFNNSSYNCLIYQDETFDNSNEIKIRAFKNGTVLKYYFTINIDKSEKIYEHSIKLFDDNENSRYFASFYGTFSDTLEIKIFDKTGIGMRVHFYVNNPEMKKIYYCPKKLENASYNGFLRSCKNPEEIYFVNGCYIQSHNKEYYLLNPATTSFERDYIKKVFSEYDIGIFKKLKKITKYTKEWIDQNGQEQKKDYFVNIVFS